MSPEQRLDIIAADAKALRRRGESAKAEVLDQIVTDLRGDLAPMELVPEATALARTGKARRWLREHFAEWQKLGAAEYREGVRWYRLCVLPTRLGYEEGRALAVEALKDVAA